MMLREQKARQNDNLRIELDEILREQEELNEMNRSANDTEEQVMSNAQGSTQKVKFKQEKKLQQKREFIEKIEQTIQKFTFLKIELENPIMIDYAVMITKRIQDSDKV